MKVLNARIKWNEGYSNNPEFEVLVDKLPECKDLDYQLMRKEGWGLYLAEKDGYVSFLAWSGKKNDGGYGGAEWQIIVNGKPVTVKGPWSSRSGVMNQCFKTQCMEVAITDDLEDFEKGYTLIGGALTIEKVYNEVFPFFYHTISLLRIVDNWGEIIYIPAKLHKLHVKEIEIAKLKKPKSKLDKLFVVE